MNKIVFWISFLFMLIGVAVFGYLDKGAAAMVTVLAGAFGMAFANIDKIELLKGAGFEARMRVRLLKKHMLQRIASDASHK